VEVKIGVQQALRELLLESAQSADEVLAAVSEALEGGAKLLSLTDDRGRQLIVPTDKIAYVEIGEPEARRVGFGNM
jgi:DNA-binding MurR/RpiR family transcriptional regulator